LEELVGTGKNWLKLGKTGRNRKELVGTWKYW